MKFAENGQRPSGHWETAAGTSGRLIGRYRCSYCGECRELATATLAKYKYCPNCGAAMSGTAEKGILHECKYKHPDCLCNRCRRDCDDCCLYGGNGDCPISECSSFEPEEVPSGGEKA